MDFNLIFKYWYTFNKIVFIKFIKLFKKYLMLYKKRTIEYSEFNIT